MRDRWMGGMVVGLSGLLLAASVLFACTRASDGQAQAAEPAQAEAPASPTEATEEPTPASKHAEEGAAVFKARCVRCHSLEETVDYIKKHPRDKRESYLTDLLARHFPPPARERPALVKYLLEETARSAR
jgi:mono/diheme cytochrome c family protein